MKIRKSNRSMTDEFEIGDIVELRSGGGEMTLEEVGQNSVTCRWRTKAGSVKRDKFPPACLRKAQAPFSLNVSNLGSLGVSVGERRMKQNDLPTAASKQTVAGTTTKNQKE
jgi:uncharacterized protein YodC (DUF2158 family)